MLSVTRSWNVGKTLGLSYPNISRVATAFDGISAWMLDEAAGCLIVCDTLHEFIRIEPLPKVLPRPGLGSGHFGMCLDGAGQKYIVNAADKSVAIFAGHEHVGDGRFEDWPVLHRSGPAGAVSGGFAIVVRYDWGYAIERRSQTGHLVWRWTSPIRFEARDELPTAIFVECVGDETVAVACDSRTVRVYWLDNFGRSIDQDEAGLLDSGSGGGLELVMDGASTPIYLTGVAASPAGTICLTRYFDKDILVLPRRACDAKAVLPWLATVNSPIEIYCFAFVNKDTIVAVGRASERGDSDLFLINAGIGY